MGEGGHTGGQSGGGSGGMSEKELRDKFSTCFCLGERGRRGDAGRERERMRERERERLCMSE